MTFLIECVQMMLRIFGDALFYPRTTEAMKEFPSPTDLKGRIIVSTKPPEVHSAHPLAQKKGVVKDLQKGDKQKEPLSQKIGNLHVSEVIIFDKPSLSM